MMFSALFLLGAASISHAAVLQRYGPRIVNGTDVAPGEIPYQVSLQRARTGSHFCGGSILNEYYVVTAAHCVDGDIAANMLVIAGTVNLDRPRVSRAIQEIIIHKEYSPANSWRNDIALLKLFAPFTPSQDVGFVTLPKQDEPVQEGAIARVSGFGKLWQDGPESRILQKAIIYIAKQDYCKEMYKDLLYNIYDTQICANDPSISRGSCNGDSGGPLIVDEKLVGLVSWAKACSLTDYPTVYTRVPSYIDWIKKNAISD